MDFRVQDVDMNKKRDENMGVKIKKIYLVVDSIGFRIRPGRLNITKEQILEYIKDNPMPEDPAYSLNELIIDLSDPDNADLSFWILPINIKEETICYIETLVDKLKNYVLI